MSLTESRGLFQIARYNFAKESKKKLEKKEKLKERE